MDDALQNIGLLIYVNGDRMFRLIILIAFLFPSFSLISEEYWGLRNIDMSIPDAEYEKYNPRFLAFGTSWDRIENPDDSYNWSTIDAAIDFAMKHNAKVILVLEPESAWASDGEARAPNDLDRDTPLDDVPEKGFSATLYDYAYKLTERFLLADTGLIKYVRYAGEPQYYNLDQPHWVASKENYEQDVEDYLRCLRTVYKASHKAASDYGGILKVSHGGLYYDDQLLREWYQYGLANPLARDSLVGLYMSRYERHWVNNEQSWSDLVNRAERDADVPPCYWMDVMAGQTEWLDFFDVHHHWKPRFIFDELAAFEKQVLDSGGTLKPWFSSETAFQLNPASNTKYDERFHAADMARKWILGMAFGLEGTCTPILGMPPDKFFGLYDEDGNEYPSAEAYRFLRSIIEPQGAPEDISVGNISAYRFGELENIIDVVWYDALFDADGSIFDYYPEKPGDNYSPACYDIFGNQLAVAGLSYISVTQEPVVIIWDEQEVQSDLAKYEPTDGYVYHGVGWNYENSVQIYMDMMPDTLQPLIIQSIAGLPGTRGLSVEKVLQAMMPLGIDTNRQYVEFSISFNDEDGATDSAFAAGSRLDHYMDTLAIAFKQYSRPFFLRIGFEMNGSWNGYSPYIYPAAFRKLVKGLRSRGADNFATVWCYEPDAEADFADSNDSGFKWYPGDDVVDWFGLDIFDYDHFDQSMPDYDRGKITKKGKSELFLDFAKERDKPVYLNEVSCRHENITADESDPGYTDGMNDWEHWFEPWFEFIEVHPNIKAFNYINLNWVPIDRYTTWGDCRLEINTYIKNHWIGELGDTKFIHAGYDINLPEEGIFVLVSPNGSEFWEAGSEEDIIWINADFENIKIEMSTDNGNNWEEITSSTPAAPGTYKWKVYEDYISDSCLIKISNTDNSKEFDISDNVFAIYQLFDKSITLNSPNGGENWEAGQKEFIKWDSENIENIIIEYSVDGGGRWTTIEESYDASDGEYYWEIPDRLSDNCYVRVSDTEGLQVYDESDRQFNIISDGSRYISLLYPEDGASIFAGNDIDIQWESQYIDNIKIKFTSNGGAVWDNLANSVPADSGIYTWSVPFIYSDSCMIRVAGVEYPGKYDENEGYFNIIYNDKAEDTDKLSPIISNLSLNQDILTFIVQQNIHTDVITDIYDICGNHKLHFESGAKQGRFYIPVRGLAPGLYMIRIYCGYALYTNKILKY